MAGASFWTSDGIQLRGCTAGPTRILEMGGILFPYWLLFAYFAGGSVLTRHDSPRWLPRRMLTVGAIIVALLIGMRFQVGGDWGTYEFLFVKADYVDLDHALAMGDPAYQFVNWTIHEIGGEIWGVNLICGLVFSWGLLSLAKTQPNPWLAMTVAVPYLVIVVAMGYSRQGVALGILMAGLAALHRGASVLKFALYVAAAALFHRTAVVALPLAIFASGRNKIINTLGGLASFAVLYDTLLANSLDNFVESYIDPEFSSQGAVIRVAMNLVPAIIFLINRNGFGFAEQEKALWRNFSLAAFGMLALLLVLPSSTVVDRLSLYILPLQVVVLSRLPVMLRSPGVATVGVIIYSALVMFVWLNFAVHAEKWLPYQVYPIG